MPVELRIAVFGAIFLIAQVFATGTLKNRQYGHRWSAGPRDEGVAPLTPVAGRAVRALENFKETFPVAVVGLLGVVLAGRESTVTLAGGWIWLIARLVYLPLYLAGVPILRSIAFQVSLLGLAMLIVPLLIR